MAHALQPERLFLALTGQISQMRQKQKAPNWHYVLDMMVNLTDVCMCECRPDQLRA
jgi:2-iminoacetate synthase ThiH